MKTHFQLTLEHAVAFFFASGWALFWLLAVQPAPIAPHPTVHHPEVIRLIADDETLKKLSAPTLFALPSDEGFSGRFVADQVIPQNTPEKPANPIRYLPRPPFKPSSVAIALMPVETLLPVQPLPIPDITPRTPPLPENQTQLFPSPELKPRAGALSSLNEISGEVPATLRVYLTVRPDGAVEHAFCDTPVTNSAVLQAVRNLVFKPAKNPTEGWIDLRFTEEKTP